MRDFKDDKALETAFNANIAEKLSALKAEDILAGMAQKGSRRHALSILKRVSTTNQPLEFDRV
ncbi:MAG TPA: hypothetical protein PLV58_09035 [Campylobacterales bacterium]|nr:hypothetical protein [Campylobacterales bacterium]